MKGTGQRSPRRGGRRSESGQVIVWATILLPITLVAAGLAFDVGNMINIRDELTNAVDAASLAGAQALMDPSASDTHVRNGIRNVALQNRVPSLRQDVSGVALDPNPGNDAGGDIVLGRWDFGAHTFTPATPPIDISMINAIRINARLSRVAGPLPLAFGRVVGVPEFDTVRTALSVIGGPVEATPMAPLAVDMNAFTGRARSFRPPNDILITSRGAPNVAGTGFGSAASTAEIRSLVNNPNRIPEVALGDVVSLAPNSGTLPFGAMRRAWPPNSIVTVPVVTFTNLAAGHGTVQGFAAIRIRQIRNRDPRFIEGTIESIRMTSTAATEAECYGLSCRSFLVN